MLNQANNATIMIIDDVEQNIEILGNILHEAGYHLITATGALDAISILDNVHPDIILLDIMMPGMNGFELCEQIKANKNLQEIPIIFLTAKADTRDIIRGFEVGGIDYVTKPFNSTELLVRIQTHIRTKRLREELLQANKKLEELNQTKTKFFSIIAHDIRSPLSGVYTLLDSLAIKVKKDNEVSHYVNIMQQSFQKLFNLLENLLEWSRVELDSFSINKERINILEPIRTNVSLFSELAMQKEIEIKINSSEPRFVNVDINMLNTIIRNLLTNAIKFTNKGGIIQINYTSKNGYLELQIKDNGVGMDQHKVKNLFSSGTVKTTPGTKNEKGSGLGLLLCREMVERNGGRIKAESEPGKGTTFYVHIELVE